jgi:norsolorinic acid ketoreductase
LALFQACVSRMSKGAKFVFMSSGASPIDRVPDKEDAGYGITKVRPAVLR